jgi:hypothetical protein
MTIARVHKLSALCKAMDTSSSLYQIYKFISINWILNWVIHFENNPIMQVNLASDEKYDKFDPCRLLEIFRFNAVIEK